jgi:hypothetical protein
MSAPFNAEQLIASMQAPDQSASACLLSIFDILDAQLQQHPHDIDQKALFNQALVAFCTTQAEKVNASHPSILAEHILLIAQNAFNQQIQQADAQSLAHAKKAASALIMAQTQLDEPAPTSHIKRYAAFASVAAIGFGLFYFWPLLQQSINPPQTAAIAPINIPAPTIKMHTQDDGLSANQASAMYAQYELMRSGTCRYLEALQIPDEHKAIYIDSVVGGKLPTNLGDLAIANEYLKKISCNYTPMLMKKSK